MTLQLEKDIQKLSDVQRAEPCKGNDPITDTPFSSIPKDRQIRFRVDDKDLICHDEKALSSFMIRYQTSKMQPVEPVTSILLTPEQVEFIQRRYVPRSWTPGSQTYMDLFPLTDIPLNDMIGRYYQ